MTSPTTALERDAAATGEEREETTVPIDPLWAPVSPADLLRALELLAAGTPLPQLLEQLRRQWAQPVA